MVTISDKHFGELLGKAAALELAMEFAENQAEVIQKQEEASRAGMKEIRRLREELAVSKACEQRLIDELAAVRAEFEQSKKDVEYWHELFLSSRKTINAVGAALDKEFS